jgi:hypothetical protein
VQGKRSGGVEESIRGVLIGVDKQEWEKRSRRPGFVQVVQ